MTKSASYRFGLDWIAENDDPDELSLDSIEQYISTALLADLFGKEPREAAKEIRRRRLRKLSLAGKENG